jgi:hypothetical protein
MDILSAADWFTNEKSLALATWGLVAVTAMLVFDGWRSGREQSKRWGHEDERRAEESKPSAVVELATCADAIFSEMYFACFNLGSNTFFVDKLIVTTTDGTQSESDLAPLIVTPGTFVTIDYDPSLLLGVFGQETPYKEGNGVLVLKGATATVTTDPVWFYVGYGSGGRKCSWGMGRLADRGPGLITKIPKVLPAKLLSQNTTLR